MDLRDFVTFIRFDGDKDRGVDLNVHGVAAVQNEPKGGELAGVATVHSVAVAQETIYVFSKDKEDLNFRYPTYRFKRGQDIIVFFTFQREC